MNIAVITAKGNNSQLANKNLIKVCGKSFIEHQFEAAENCDLIDFIYISTSDIDIINESEKIGISVIKRPDELSQPDTNHGDVISHIVEELEKLHHKINTITILLGNTLMVSPIDIQNCITNVNSSDKIDSSMTVWKAQDDHPLRSMKINDHGFLESYLNVKNVDTNRQSYEDVYYYDQGPWTFKMKSFKKYQIERTGPGPWWWMAKNCKPELRYWVTGRDIHDNMDVRISEFWQKNIK
jgi:CMP-N-acetylneuraminic acid synthetase